MKLYIYLFLISSSLCFSQTFNTSTLLNNGPNDNRINIAIVGDGFLSTQQTELNTGAQSILDYLFLKSPFKEYKNYFNAYAIGVISNEAGVKHPGDATDVTEPVFPVADPDNYCGSTFDVGAHRCVYSYTTNTVGDILASNVPDYDIAYVMVNSTEYGGCSGDYPFGTLNTSANETFVHELGHFFAFLADEYWFTVPGESINKTQNSDTTTNRWKNWLGTGGVGIYPHAESPTWFRPHQNCEMRYLNRQFCAVCKEGIVERIHDLISPIDSYTPANSTVIDINTDMSFSVDEILPSPNTLVNTWALNGILLSETNSTITINPAQLNTGSNSLLFSVTDNTSFVRTDNHSTIHFSTVLWTLNKAPLGTTDIIVEKKEFSIYPNPSTNAFFIKGKKAFSSNLKINIADITGKNIPVKFELIDDTNIGVDTNGLASGTYIVSATENNKVIFSQKIIINN